MANSLSLVYDGLDEMERSGASPSGAWFFYMTAGTPTERSKP